MLITDLFIQKVCVNRCIVTVNKSGVICKKKMAEISRRNGVEAGVIQRSDSRRSSDISQDTELVRTPSTDEYGDDIITNLPHDEGIPYLYQLSACLNEPAEFVASRHVEGNDNSNQQHDCYSSYKEGNIIQVGSWKKVNWTEDIFEHDKSSDFNLSATDIIEKRHSDYRTDKVGKLCSDETSERNDDSDTELVIDDFNLSKVDSAQKQHTQSDPSQHETLKTIEASKLIIGHYAWRDVNSPYKEFNLIYDDELKSVDGTDVENIENYKPDKDKELELSPDKTLKNIGTSKATLRHDERYDFGSPKHAVIGGGHDGFKSTDDSEVTFEHYKSYNFDSLKADIFEGQQGNSIIDKVVVVTDDDAFDERVIFGQDKRSGPFPHPDLPDVVGTHISSENIPIGIEEVIVSTELEKDNTDDDRIISISSDDNDDSMVNTSSQLKNSCDEGEHKDEHIPNQDKLLLEPVSREDEEDVLNILDDILTNDSRGSLKTDSFEDVKPSDEVEIDVRDIIATVLIEDDHFSQRPPDHDVDEHRTKAMKIEESDGQTSGEHGNLPKFGDLDVSSDIDDDIGTGTKDKIRILLSTNYQVDASEFARGVFDTEICDFHAKIGKGRTYVSDRSASIIPSPKCPYCVSNVRQSPDLRAHAIEGPKRYKHLSSQTATHASLSLSEDTLNEVSSIGTFDTDVTKGSLHTATDVPEFTIETLDVDIIDKDDAVVPPYYVHTLSLESLNDLEVDIRTDNTGGGDKTVRIDEPIKKKGAGEEGTQGIMTKLLKEELKYKIQIERLSRGEEELKLVPETPKVYEMTEEERLKREVRMRQNRESAIRSRDKFKARRQHLQEIIAVEYERKAELSSTLEKLQREKAKYLRRLQQHSDSCANPAETTDLLDAIAKFKR